MKLVIGISGASGYRLGERLLELLPSGIEKHVVVSESAKVVAKYEEMRIYGNDDISAPISSGSFGADAMIIVPCSMNTLAKIACGIADNLLTRAASVMIKEQKKLLLAPREMPLSPIALENMLKLSRLGVIVSPPMLSYYAECGSLEEMERFVVGKWLDSLGIQNDLYIRWGAE